jgi:hypothetical protein
MVVSFSQCGTSDLELSCFWLYSGSSGAEGSCKDKNDASLECTSVMNGDQCRMGLQGTTIKDDCFWIEGHASGSEGTCVKKVLCSVLVCNIILWGVILTP